VTDGDGENHCAPSCTAFATPEWFDAWLDAFGEGAGGIWRSGEGGNSGCAIPYVLEQVPVAPMLRLKAAISATNDHTPRYDVLGMIPTPNDLFNQMSLDLGVSVLRFDYLSERSNLLQALGSAPSGLLFAIDFCEDSPFVNCDLQWEQYWNSLGSMRTLWARRERKLMSGYGAAFRCLREWGEIEPVLDAIYDVEASGWKGREGTAIKQRPETLRFYNRCLRDWARRGWLRVFLLVVGERIVAFQINVLFDRVLTQLKVGYEESFAKVSPGQVLQLQLLRWAFAQPDVHIYDMLGGGGKAEKTKRKWATDAEPLYSLWIFRRNLQGLLAWIRFVAAPPVKHRLTGRPGKQHSPIQRDAA
jgi:hypothetical protein